MGDVSYRSDGEVRKFVFRGLEAVSRWSSRARPPDADGGTSRPREGSLRGLRSFLASLQDASWEVDLDRWHRSCLAQPPAKGSQASGLNAMGCSTFKVVWGWGDEMKRAKARTTSGVTGTQRKSVGASELSRRDRRSQFGGDHSFSGGCCLDHAAAGGPTALPATLWRARLRMDDGLGAGTLFTLSACSGWGAFLTSYCAAPKGTANNVRRCPLGGDRLDWGGPHEESGTGLQPVVMGMKRLKTCSTLAGAATGEWRLQPATPSLPVS